MRQPDLFRMPKKPWNAGSIICPKAPLKPKRLRPRATDSRRCRVRRVLPGFFAPVISSTEATQDSLPQLPLASAAVLEGLSPLRGYFQGEMSDVS
jgi:hypothetical protein